MSTDIDTILKTGFYYIPNDDSIMVTGHEIYRSIRQARVSDDTIIALVDTGYYKGIVGDSTTYMQGGELLSRMAEAEFIPIMGWGAAMLGLVLGACLSLINHHRDKGQYSLQDLAIIAGTLMSTVVMVFFDHSARLLGFYGVGVGVGFIVFFLFTTYLLREAKDNPQSWSGRVYESITGNRVEP